MADIPHSNDSPAAPVTNSALPKNPFTETQPNNNLNPLASSDLSGKPAESLAANTGGAAAPAPSNNSETATAPILPPSSGANGSVGKTESAVSEDINKQTNAPSAAVMTGALALTGDSSTAASSLPHKPVQSTEKDGVEDITGTHAVPKPTAPSQSDGFKDAATGSNSSAAPTGAPSALNGTDKKDAAGSTGLASLDKPTAVPAEKQDVEMKDASAPSTSEKPPTLASAPSAAPPAAPPAAGADVSGLTGATGAPTPTPALATPATAVTEATGEKRKADSDAPDGVEEPAAKKQQGAFSKAVDKAKSAIHDVKQKAKPGRKPGSKAKKEAAPPPVGRTERKTRSQARAE